MTVPHFHGSWPPSARALLLGAIQRHGGWERWTRLRSLTLGFAALEGLLPWLKGNGRTFVLPRWVRTFPKEGRTEWSDVEGGMPVGRFDADAGPPRRPGPRGRWTSPDALYFFGYALASYAGMPFALPALPFLAETRRRWRGEELRGVQIRHQPEAHVHSPVQTYLFDATGLLRRNDYVAEFVGRWWTGAHGMDDHADVGGLQVPRLRTVLPRLGRLVAPGPVVLRARLDGLSVDFG